MYKLIILFFLILSPTKILALSLDDYTLIYDSYKLEASGKIPLAIDKVIQVYQKEKSNYLINLRLAWLFSLDNKLKNSEQHYLNAAEIIPKSLDPWLALSKMYLDLSQWKTATKYAEEILERDPNHYLGHLRFIQASIQQKDFEKALEKLGHILLLYPLDVIFIEQKAYCLNQLRKDKEAHKAVLELLLVSPHNEYGKNFMRKNH